MYHVRVRLKAHLILISILVWFYQHYSAIASLTESLAPSNAKKICFSNATFAQRIGTGIAHVVSCFFTYAAYMPTWNAKQKQPEVDEDQAHSRTIKKFQWFYKQKYLHKENKSNVSLY